MIGITDQTSIFTGGFFNQNGSIPDNIDVFLAGWFESDTVIEDYQEYSSLPNNFFQEESIDYDVESNLYDLLATEAINQNGVPMVYYVTSFNTSYDKVFGEDNNRNIVRNFKIMAQYDLPQEIEQYSSFGIEGIDNFHVFVTKKHLEEASQYNSDQTRKVYPSYTPKEGDFLKALYQDLWYEVVNVKQQAHQFLKRQHVFQITVRPKRDENLSISASIPSDDSIREIESIFDIFSVSGSIDQETPDKLYDNTGNEQNDPLFGSWG